MREPSLESSPAGARRGGRAQGSPSHHPVSPSPVSSRSPFLAQRRSPKRTRPNPTVRKSQSGARSALSHPDTRTAQTSAPAQPSSRAHTQAPTERVGTFPARRNLSCATHAHIERPSPRACAVQHQPLPGARARALRLRSTEARAAVLRRTEGAPRGRGRCGGGAKGQEAEEGPRGAGGASRRGAEWGRGRESPGKGRVSVGAGLRSPEGGGGLPEHGEGVRGTTDRYPRGGVLTGCRGLGLSLLGFR